MGVSIIPNNCPVDCSASLTFGALDTDQNCSPKTFLSEISDLWIRPSGAGATANPFTGWAAYNSSTLMTVTANAIDNAATDNSKAKWLVGIGNIDAPEKSTQQLPKFKSKITQRTYTLNFQILNLSDEQYEFLRSLQCNPSNFDFWYGNENHVFGIEEGLTPNLVDVDFIYASGEESVETANLILEWKTETGDPQRRNNPYS